MDECKAIHKIEIIPANLPIVDQPKLKISKSAGDRVWGRSRSKDWAVKIGDALDTVHQQGIIRRGIKPANIFITERKPRFWISTWPN